MRWTELTLFGIVDAVRYFNMPNTLHELKNNIIEEINRVTPDILEKIIENTVRVYIILETHLMDIIK